jgi:hypothetical protein
MPKITTRVNRGESRNTQLSDIFINTLVIAEIPEGVINTTQPTLRVTKPIDTGTSILNRVQRTSIKAINLLVSKVNGRASVEVAVASPTETYTKITVSPTATSPSTFIVNGNPQEVTWAGTGLVPATLAFIAAAKAAGLIIYNQSTSAGTIGVVNQDSSPFTISGTGVAVASEFGGNVVTALDYLKCINRLTALDIGELPVGFLVIPSAYTKLRASDCHLVTAAASELARKHNMVLLVDAPNPDLILQTGVNTGSAYTAPPAHPVGSLFNYSGNVYQVVTVLAVTTATNGTAYPLNSLVFVPALQKTYRSLSPSATFVDIAVPTEAELLNFIEERPKNVIQRWLNIGGIIVVDQGYTTPDAYKSYVAGIPEGLEGQIMTYVNYWADGTGNSYPASSLVAAYFIETWINETFLRNHAGNNYPIPEIVGLTYAPKEADLAEATNFNYLGSKGNYHISGVRTNASDSKFRWLTGAITVAMVRRQATVASAAIQYQPLQGINALLGSVQNTYIAVLERLAFLFFDRQYRVIADLTNNTLEDLQDGKVNVKLCVKLTPDIDEVSIEVAVKALNEELV